MSLVVIVSTFSIAFWVFIAWRLSARFSDAMHFGVLFALLFVVNYPLKLIFTEYGFPSAMDSLALEPIYRLMALGLSNLCALAFVAPLFFFKLRVPLGTPEDYPQVLQTKKTYLWLFLFLGFEIIGVGPEKLVYLLDFGRATDLIEIRTEERLDSAMAGLLRFAGMAALIMHVSSVASKWVLLGKKSYFMVFIVWPGIMYFFLVLTGSKQSVLILPLLAVILFNYYRRIYRQKFYSFQTIMGFLLVGVLLVGLLGYLRGFGTLYGNPLEQMLQQGLYAFDAIDNFAFIIYRMGDYWRGDLDFLPTIHNLSVSVVPRFFWPDKPLVMSNQFIMQIYLPERFTGHLGEAVSPSMPGEFMLSGGIFFMLFWSAAIGLLFYFFYFKTHQPKAKLFFLMGYLFLAININNLLRSGDGMLGIFVVFCVVALIVRLTFFLFLIPSGKKNMPVS